MFHESRVKIYQKNLAKYQNQYRLIYVSDVMEIL